MTLPHAKRARDASLREARFLLDDIKGLLGVRAREHVREPSLRALRWEEDGAGGGPDRAHIPKAFERARVVLECVARDAQVHGEGDEG